MRQSGADRLSPPAAVALAGCLALAIVFALAPSVPRGLDGIDSTNFVLAVDHYAPALHQPHPPGYPVHVALGRLATEVYRRLTAAGAEGEVGTAVAGLRLWSIFCGLLTVYGVRRLALELGAPPERAWVAAGVFTACPLVLITSMRSLSDAPGLLFVVGSQVLILAAHNRSGWRAPDHADSIGPHQSWSLAAGAALAGLAVGVRVQTALLTTPLLVLTLVGGPAGRRGYKALWAGGAFVAGLLAWAVPMLLTVGPSEYLRAVLLTVDDDVQGVAMLATSPSLRLLRTALVNTFIVPWGWAPVGWAALGLAVAGTFSLWRTEPRRLAAVLAIGVPYLAFHLGFQETASIRYALPLMMVEACLVAAALGIGRRLLPVILLVATAGAVVSVRAATAFWHAGSPVARSLEDLRHAAVTPSGPPTLAFHHNVQRAERGSSWPGAVLDAPVRYEWLELVDYWLGGGRAPVWFLANSRRTDLALVDPRSRKLVRSYRWPASVEPLLGGIQPLRVDWHEIRDPGWVLQRGWSLTPETHGVSRRDGHMAGGRGIEGRIRRRRAAAVMMIGGRNLGGPCDTGAVVEAFIDGKRVTEWTAPSQAPFLQVVRLAPGDLEGEGPFARLRVTARDMTGTARLVDVAIESFDLQSPGTAMAAFAGGWHVPELDTTSGAMWRWMDEAAELQIEGFGQDVELTIRGASPSAHFRTAPAVEIRAGETLLAAFKPETSYSRVLRVPATTLTSSGGRLTLRSDQWFIPDERDGNGDRRRLSLQVYALESRPVP